MPSAFAIITTTTALALASSSEVSASDPLLRGGRNDGLLSLGAFQRVLRTSLDEELDLIAAGADRGSCQDCHSSAVQPQNQLVRSRANIRRSNSNSNSNNSNNFNTLYSPEHVWTHLLQHAWSVAESITAKDDGTLTRMTNTQGKSSYQHQFPFLLCSTSNRDVSSLFEQDERSHFWEPNNDGSSNSCIVLTTKASWARQAMKSHPDIIAQPLVDIMKIQPGTVERVSSPEWKIPFTGVTPDPTANDGQQVVDQLVPPQARNKNATEVVTQDWERTLTIDISPGLEIREEADFLQLVNTIMQDLQEMSEVGWLMRQSDEHDEDLEGMNIKAWQQQYLVNHSLVGVPSLSEMFSLTSTFAKSQENDHQDMFHKNDRVAYWDTSLANGLESSHACASLFSTLLVNPHRSSYAKFDLVF